MATTTNTQPTTRTDRDGFPVVDCSRCGGTGRFSFNLMDGDRCYGCGGTGVTWKRGKVAKAAIALAAARKAAKQVIVRDIVPGEVVSLDRKTWVTIERVDVDLDQPMGWSGDHTAAKAAGHIGSDDSRGIRSGIICSHTTCTTCWTVTSHRCTIVATDGTTRSAQTGELLPRKGSVDVAPFLAMAGIK